MSYLQTDSIKIDEKDLSARERKVLEALRNRKEPLHLSAITISCFPGQRSKPGTYGTGEKGGGTKRAYRCSLNSVRRLVAGGFIKRVERGTYQAVGVEK